MTFSGQGRVAIALSRGLMLAAMAVCAASALSAQTGREPSIGYLYPAGGQQGLVIRIVAGGQNLRGVNSAYVSGEKVRASVVEYIPPPMRLDGQQRRELMRRLAEVVGKRWPGLARQGGRFTLPQQAPAAEGAGEAGTAAAKEVTLPDHPLLRDLENKSPQELREVVEKFLRPVNPQQIKRSIVETVAVEIAIDADAAPGERELRLGSPLGMTNPLRFEVGWLPEVREEESYGMQAPPAPTVDPPVVLNGQITTKDVDRFTFRAKRGQRLVIAAEARKLIPYMADAVPGWFQAVLALYDADGREVAFADDYRFDPDPVLFYVVPQDGEYALEIRDAIYRGRDDFVYRIAVGEQPFITQMFPLGGREGAATAASVSGWNLPWEQVQFDAQPGGGEIRHASWGGKEWRSNDRLYAVDALSECEEGEPNDSAGDAQKIALPQIVNGRIGRIGDVDVFRFEGRAGDEVVAEVYARRLGSALDSLVRLADASGRALAWNDDYEDKGAGLITHHADSYLRARLPQDGAYLMFVSDAQQQGGGAYAYRLRVGPPRPDFALRVTPSSINAFAGRAVPITVYALRKDGFDGEIELVLKDAPAGFALSGGRIPAGRESMRMTLSAPRDPLDSRFALHLDGHAKIGGAVVSRPAVPADSMMQAFAYRHLVPAQELMVSVPQLGRRVPDVHLITGVPVRIPVGGTAEVQVSAPQAALSAGIKLELSEPPKGVTLQGVNAVPGGYALVLKADGVAAQVGYVDNLIVEAFVELENPRQGGKAATQKRRVPLGALPAIPFEIVKR